MPCRIIHHMIQLLKPLEITTVPVSDCKSAKLHLGQTFGAGIYNLSIVPGKWRTAECDKDGWTVIQSRFWMF